MTEDLLHKLKKSRSQKFLALVELVELNPKIDFRYADLTNSDFRNQNLLEFDFSYSDMTGSEFGGATFNAESLRKGIFFNNEYYNKLDENEIYLYNCARLNARYYDRIAYIAGYSMYDPREEKIKTLHDIIENEKSLYVISFSQNIIDIISDELDASGKKAEIARMVMRQSYPLDRAKLREKLRELSKSLEFMRSYMNFN
ncbi:MULTISPECIES: pentapeptide repeat-containing protein [unclassified Rhizobium]|uniref:pentapeptide repeat-containing protein n=1 Tax=unclassified Rhizobium TaxID=2613769 RepID=UPI000EA8F347|nr:MULTISPECIES: pentapeptide repeat-containing protein [unclassified Rhizobium]AYG66642.1 hypothetical protein CCGE531_12030 [Rhizobium sp. CCGE531]AYG73022.1 hypothetical protein CCGE532_11455 [Rhizobium sp. CCGE532]